MNTYRPDFVTPPGDSLSELIETLGMSQVELAKRMGRPTKTINEIIKGIARVTSETALQLERVLGTPASFWNQREAHYQEFLARQAETEALEKQKEWLKKVPVRQLIKHKWIVEIKDKVEQSRLLLNFFGVASPEQWDAKCRDMFVAYRRASVLTEHVGAVAAWLRQGELTAQHIQCQPYSKEVFRSNLQEIRKLTLTNPEHYSDELRALCAEAGVAIAIVPDLPGTGICGATRWLNPHKALIQLGLRYKTDDQFWFTFFHEAGHVLLHAKSHIFLEDHKISKDEDEEEANRFAANQLIPEKEYDLFLKSLTITEQKVRAFAQQIGIAPSIVVGRLQHDKLIGFNQFYQLKTRLKWKE